MGSEMAFNLFSKTYAESSESQFYVCDPMASVTTSFRQNFQGQFPGARLQVVDTPAEYVPGFLFVMSALVHMSLEH